MRGEDRAKERPLHRMFTAVPPKYDLVNRVFTWGLDDRWRRKTADICLETSPQKAMDLCCGTGDLAVWLGRLAEPSTQVLGLDYAWPMLERAVEKAQRFALHTRVSFIQGDVANLPFTDGFFDCIGISFAFRNLTYKNPMIGRYLAEVMRVLKPGGKFVIVESSQPPNWLVRSVFHGYARWFIFRVGYWISKNRPAYKYLSESIQRFYTAEELSELLAGNGFKKVRVNRMLFGVAAIHTASK